jgi:peptidoglycan/xylan/chitin deacetylase (PgdA/CDA1 family)
MMDVTALPFINTLHGWVLTIDDAPSEDMEQKLDILDSLGVNAIWFVVGQYAQNRSAALVRAVQRGDILGNHGYSHRPFSKMSPWLAKKEIQQTEHLIDAIYAQAGMIRPVRLFRFPYGYWGYGKNGVAWQNGQTGKWSFGNLRYTILQRLLQSFQFENVYKHLDWRWDYDMAEYTILQNYCTPVAQEEFLLEKVRDFLQQPNAQPAHCASPKPQSTIPKILLMHDHNNNGALFSLCLRYITLNS